MVSSQVGCCREGAAVAVSWVVAHLRTSSRQQAMTTARRPSPRNCLFHLFLLLLLLLLVVEGGGGSCTGEAILAPAVGTVEG